MQFKQNQNVQQRNAAKQSKLPKKPQQQPRKIMISMNNYESDNAEEQSSKQDEIIYENTWEKQGRELEAKFKSQQELIDKQQIPQQEIQSQEKTQNIDYGSRENHEQKLNQENKEKQQTENNTPYKIKNKQDKNDLDDYGYGQRKVKGQNSQRQKHSNAQYRTQVYYVAKS